MITVLRHRYKKHSLFSKKNNYIKKLYNLKYFTSASNGRSLIYALIKEIKLKKKDQVLLPVYAPEGITIPFKVLGIKIIYYKSDKYLEPEFNDIKKKIQSFKKIKLFIKIHNMGFYNIKSNLINYLKKKEISLVEDIAQTNLIKPKLLKKNKYSNTYYLFSFNKIFPVSDGAFLASNSLIVNKINSIRRLKTNYKAINNYKKHLFYNNKISNYNFSAHTKLNIIKSSDYYENYYMRTQYDLNLREISKESLFYLNYIDTNKIIKQRNHNLNLFYKNFNSSKIKLFYKTYNEPTYPMAIPLILTSSKNKIINYLKKNNILPSIQKNRWNYNYICKNKDKFKYEYQYIQNHILLSINEEMSQQDIIYINKVLNYI